MLALEAVRPGVESWIAEAEAHGLGVAIASSSAYEWVHGHLERLGLRERFSHLACPSDTRCAASPNPTRTSPRAPRSACNRPCALAVEDSPNGVAAAKAAGLTTIVVPHELTETLDLSPAPTSGSRRSPTAASPDACARLGHALPART